MSTFSLEKGIPSGLVYRSLSSENENRFLAKYELGSFLGSGAFAEVWQCTNRESGQEFACKIFGKRPSLSLSSGSTQRQAACPETEVSILKQFQGRCTGSVPSGVVQMREVVEGELATVVVMELCKGGSLFDLLKQRGRMPEKSAKLIFIQLTSALAELHAEGIVHRDIKPENILLSGPGHGLYSVDHKRCFAETESDLSQLKAKICDFNLALRLGEEAVGEGHAFCGGSKHYCAPEVVRRMACGKEADIWGLGVVLYCMLSGRLPFTGQSWDDERGLRRAILRGMVSFDGKQWSDVSPAAKLLLKKMLALDPKERPSAACILSSQWCASTNPTYWQAAYDGGAFLWSKAFQALAPSKALDDFHSFDVRNTETVFCL